MSNTSGSSSYLQFQSTSEYGSRFPGAQWINWEGIENEFAKGRLRSGHRSPSRKRSHSPNRSCPQTTEEEMSHASESEISSVIAGIEVSAADKSALKIECSKCSKLLSQSESYATPMIELPEATKSNSRLSEPDRDASILSDVRTDGDSSNRRNFSNPGSAGSCRLEDLDELAFDEPESKPAGEARVFEASPSAGVNPASCHTSVFSEDRATRVVLAYATAPQDQSAAGPAAEAAAEEPDPATVDEKTVYDPNAPAEEIPGTVLEKPAEEQIDQLQSSATKDSKKKPKPKCEIFEVLNTTIELSVLPCKDSIYSKKIEECYAERPEPTRDDLFCAYYENPFDVKPLKAADEEEPASPPTPLEDDRCLRMAMRELELAEYLKKFCCQYPPCRANVDASARTSSKPVIGKGCGVRLKFDPTF